MEFPAKICKQHSQQQFQKVCKSLTAYVVIALFFAEKEEHVFVRHLYLDDICLPPADSMVQSGACSAHNIQAIEIHSVIINLITNNTMPRLAAIAAIALVGSANAFTGEENLAVDTNDIVISILTTWFDDLVCQHVLLQYHHLTLPS
jgi:hypothetical protein